jgi:hypothetical protein
MDLASAAALLKLRRMVMNEMDEQEVARAKTKNAHDMMFGEPKNHVAYYPAKWFVCSLSPIRMAPLRAQTRKTLFRLSSLRVTQY